MKTPRNLRYKTSNTGTKKISVLEWRSLPKKQRDNLFDNFLSVCNSSRPVARLKKELEISNELYELFSEMRATKLQDDSESIVQAEIDTETASFSSSSDDEAEHDKAERLNDLVDSLQLFLAGGTPSEGFLKGLQTLLTSEERIQKTGKQAASYSAVDPLPESPIMPPPVADVSQLQSDLRTRQEFKVFGEKVNALDDTTASLVRAVVNLQTLVKAEKEEAPLQLTEAQDLTFNAFAAAQKASASGTLLLTLDKGTISEISLVLNPD